MSVRKEYEQVLKTDWAAIPALAGVRVIATERGLDTLSQPTFLIRARSIGKTPEAPNSHRNVGFLGTLISPHQDLDRAQDQLDELVEAILDYFDPRALHDDAVSVGYDDTHMAYDIPLTILASKE